MKRRELDDSEKREYKKIVDIYNSIKDENFKNIIELLYQNRFFKGNINRELKISQISKKLGLKKDVIYDLIEKYNDESYRFVRIYQLSKERWAVWYTLFDDVMDAFTLDRTINGKIEEISSDEYDEIIDISGNERDI